MKLQLPQYPQTAVEQILVILALGTLSLIFSIIVLGCQDRKIPVEFVDLLKLLIPTVAAPVAFDKLTAKHNKE